MKHESELAMIEHEIKRLYHLMNKCTDNAEMGRLMNIVFALRERRRELKSSST